MTRVLLADDQALVRAGFRSLVNSADGIEVVAEASDGADAVRQTHEHHPDVILMDIRMPGIDGLEATRLLRGGDCPPVVVLLSTYDEDAGDQFVAESGAAAYVTKSALGPDRLRVVWGAAVP